MEQEFFRENPELVTDKKILLAVSTGVDSMVLLHLLEQQGVNIGIAHVNHQLRSESKKKRNLYKTTVKRASFRSI